MLLAERCRHCIQPHGFHERDFGRDKRDLGLDHPTPIGQRSLNGIVEEEKQSNVMKPWTVMRK